MKFGVLILQLRVVSPALLFMLACIISLLAIDYESVRGVFLLVSFVCFQLFMQISYDMETPSLIEKFYVSENKSENNKKLFGLQMLFFSWATALYICADLWGRPLNSITGLFLLYFIYWGSMFYTTIEDDVRFEKTFLSSSVATVFFKVTNVVCLLSAIGAVFLGSWDWNYW